MCKLSIISRHLFLRVIGAWIRLTRRSEVFVQQDANKNNDADTTDAADYDAN